METGIVVTAFVLTWFFGFVTGAAFGVNFVFSKLKTITAGGADKVPRVMTRAEKLNLHKYNDFK